MVKIVMDAQDRLMVDKLFPEEGDMKTITLMKDIRGKTSLSVEEMEKIQYMAKGGKFQFAVEEAASIKKDVELSDTEIMFLKERVEDLDGKKKISEITFDLCVKIREGGKKVDKKDSGKD